MITYPDEEAYTARQDNEFMHSIFNTAKGTNVSIDRYEMTENFDPVEELKSLVSKDLIKEENGITYGVPADNVFLRFINNDYYYYLLVGSISGVEATDELLEEVKGIVLSAAIDSSIPVEEPVKANDVFHFQSQYKIFSFINFIVEHFVFVHGHPPVQFSEWSCIYFIHIFAEACKCFLFRLAAFTR